ncbi:hypothetical protein [Archangium violaceum]|uniref:hypothetical protein n=1 Tax=Archangium violaceum TaxID=83451 RepID=UPI000699104F|nr:hypothetical protein [Archangium violaceum]
MRIRETAAALTLLFLSSGCANRFKQLYPGMTRQQVVEQMERAPSRTELFEDGYSAWYYGEDQCLLFQQDVVVAKQRTEVTTNVKTPLGSLREELKPQCLPPGVTRPRRVEREVDVRLPQGVGVQGRQVQGEEKPREEPERN